jgi:hypothetical protein
LEALEQSVLEVTAMKTTITLLFQSLEDIVEIEVTADVELSCTIGEFEASNEIRQVRFCIECGNPYIEAVNKLTEWTDILVQNYTAE